MNKKTVVKLKKKKEIHFDSSGGAIPRFCTFCGSTDLTEGSLSAYENGIYCKSCNLQIHDCCTEPRYEDFKEKRGKKI